MSWYLEAPAPSPPKPAAQPLAWGGRLLARISLGNARLRCDRPSQTCTLSYATLRQRDRSTTYQVMLQLPEGRGFSGYPFLAAALRGWRLWG